MYFYSIRRLKERLAVGPLPDRESLPYLLIFILATSLAASLPTQLEDPWDWAELVTSAVMAVAGTWVLYRANGGAHGRDFLHRYIVLGWVATLRFFTMVVPAVLAFLLVAEFAGLRPESKPLFEYALSFFLEVSFVLYFGLHLDDLRDLTDSARRGGAG